MFFLLIEDTFGLWIYVSFGFNVFSNFSVYKLGTKNMQLCIAETEN